MSLIANRTSWSSKGKRTGGTKTASKSIQDSFTFDFNFGGDRITLLLCNADCRVDIFCSGGMMDMISFSAFFFSSSCVIVHRSLLCIV